ncbi:MAG: hypothetical protein PHZ16_06880, partial [Eubacteriales bacterium]|nr:hypothetical protein [Eubacteriales bacterium]
MNTFGMVDEDGSVSGMNFAIPVSVAKEFLNEINVTPGESKFTTDFKRALNLYEGGDYAAAIELLRNINDTSPGFPVVQELLADAREAYDANPIASTVPAEVDPEPSTEPVVPGVTDEDNRILGIPSTTFYVGLGALILIIV